jgi:putative SOS response-associated peptidase YedK
MCTRYIPPEMRELEDFWQIGAGKRMPSGLFRARELFPLSTGPIVRLDGEGERRAQLAQWGMIPPDSETRIPMSRPRGPGEKPKRISTVNARQETIASRPTYREAWKKGQRCIVPARLFFEPNWETGANVWWRFLRADGQPWSVAGLWSEWTDPATGEVVPSYSMVTVNADAHPLMKRMHKPDPRLGPDKQDKRSLVLLERGEVDRWLQGTVEEARALIKLTPHEVFDAAPAGPPAAQLEAVGLF